MNILRTPPAAAMFVAVLAYTGSGVCSRGNSGGNLGPVGKSCVAADVLLGDANFSSPALVVNLGRCKELSLIGNSIGDFGAAAIAEALKDQTGCPPYDPNCGALDTLTLSENNIGDSGAAAIAEALKSNTALETLYLADNNIGDSGAAAIAEALNKKLRLSKYAHYEEYDFENRMIYTALTFLSLESNNVGNSGATSLKNITALKTLYLHRNNVTCGFHGTQRTRSANVAWKSICKCSGLWSGDFCHTDVPGKTALAIVFPVAALAALVVVVNPKCIRPFRERKQAARQRKQAERAFGIAHPIHVTTVGGDAYTLEDWGHCKDLKLALSKLAPPGELGDPSTFVLLDSNGWTAPFGSCGADATSTEVDTKYSSVHRANMMQSAPDGGWRRSRERERGGIDLTLVYKASV